MLSTSAMFPATWSNLLKQSKKQCGYTPHTAHSPAYSISACSKSRIFSTEASSRTRKPPATDHSTAAFAEDAETLSKYITSLRAEAAKRSGVHEYSQFCVACGRNSGAILRSGIEKNIRTRCP